MANTFKLRRGASSFTTTTSETTKIEFLPQLSDDEHRTFLFGGAVLHTDTVPYRGHNGGNDTFRILHPISPADCVAATVAELELVLDELLSIQAMSEAHDMRQATTLLEHKTRAWSISVLETEIAARPPPPSPAVSVHHEDADRHASRAMLVRPLTNAISYTRGIELANIPRHGLGTPGSYCGSTLTEEVAEPPSNYPVR